MTSPANVQILAHEAEIGWFRNWIHNHSGIWFQDSKISILEQRLNTLCVKHGIGTFSDLRVALEQGNPVELISSMIDVATTNHTHFYREIGSIEYFLENVCDLYLNDQLRLWSAASSSGEELYTIILMIIEKYGLEHVRHHGLFLGTDLNENMIEKAEQGVYAGERLLDVPATVQNKWFKQAGLNLWSLDKTICNLAMFRRLNLLSPRWPFSKKFHVIFLRNVLYYFDEATQEIVLSKLYNASEPGGWLITSVTESVSRLKSGWVRVSSGVYRR